MRSKSEPILLSKFCLIMHLSSLHCYSTAFILHSSCPVWGKSLRPHTAFCARCPTLLLFVCVPLSYCQSSPLFLHQSLFMFSNSTDKMGDSSAVDVGPCVERRELCIHARAVTVCIRSVRKLACYLMGISICCQITFSPRPSLFLTQGHLLFKMMCENPMW